MGSKRQGHREKRQEKRDKRQETRITIFSKGVPSLRGGTTWQTYYVTQILNIKNLDKRKNYTSIAKPTPTKMAENFCKLKR